MFTNAQDVLRYIKDEDVKFVDVRFIDLPGVMQHFNMPVESFDQSVFDDGLMFDGSSIRGFQAIHESDMKLIPDPATAFIDPFRKAKTLVMNFSILDPFTDERYSRDPRNVAAKAEAYLVSTGIADTVYFGAEAEFYVFDDVRFETNQHESYYHIDSIEGAWNTGRVEEGGNRGYKTRYKGGYFPVPPVDHFADIRDDMVTRLLEVGLHVERSHHEVGTAGQGEINGLDFSPDSSTLASAGDDGTVLLRNLRNGVERLRFRAHAGLAFQALFAEGGRLLATCGNESVIRLWNAADGSFHSDLKHHSETVESIAMSTSGVLAAVSRDGQGSLWDLEKQLRIGSLDLTPKSVFNSVAFSPSGYFIAAGQVNGMVSLRRSSDASLIACQTLPDAIQSIAFSPATSDHSHWVAVGDRNGGIHLLPVDDVHAANGIVPASTQLRAGRQWIAHESRVYSLAFNPSGTRLLTAGEDGLLKVWSLDSSQVNRVAPEIGGDLALLDNDELVVCAKTLSICPLSTGNVVRDLPSPPKNWQSVRYASKVKTVFALDHSGRVFS